MIFIFDDCTLDTARRELRRGDTIVSVQPQVFDLLEYLIRNRSRVVSRDDLLASIWGGRIVSESTLATRINAARAAIGDDGESQRLIRTLPRKGIRFVGDIRTADEAAPSPQAASAGTGAERPTAPRPDADRRQLTVVSCDFVGLRELAMQLDPEELNALLGLCHARCSQVCERWGGTLAHFADEGTTMLFSHPQAHEDDPERAVRASLDLLEQIARLENGPGNSLAARVGVATGIVVVSRARAGMTQDLTAVGEASALAAALRRVAPPNGVLITARTHGLLGALFEYQALEPFGLTGFSNPVPAWQVTRPASIGSRFEALHNLNLTPLCGRRKEIDLLQRKWREAKTGKGGVVMISGEPGIGKSRVVSELSNRLAGREPYTWLRYQCSPHHRASALYPVITQLEHAAMLSPGDPPARRLDKLEASIVIPPPRRKSALPLFAALLSIPAAGRYPPLAMSPMQQRRQTLGALLDELEQLAQQQPVLAVFEDAHWADPTSIELLDLMIERIRHLRVLGLITFRPEFQAPWAGLPNVAELALERLDPAEALAIAETLAGEQPLPPAVLQQIISRTDGVPLYIEELTKNVLESQQSQRSADAPPQFSIPSTLEDTLRARIERLPEVKEVAQIGAAIGRSFAFKVISAVTSLDSTVLNTALGRLADASLILRQGSAPDVVYTFKHALVQDAAYESLLRSQRAPLHARIAGVIENQFPEIAETQPELAAYHYSHAELDHKAVAFWLKAGARAVSRSENLEAINHLRNGLQRLGAIDSEHERAPLELEMQLMLGQALIATRGYTSAETGVAFKRAEALVEQIGDAGQRYSVLYGTFVGHLIGGHIKAATDTIDRMYQLAGAGGDDAFLCLVYRLRGGLRFFHGDVREAAQDLEQAIALCTPPVQERLGLHFGPDSGAAAQIFLAMTEWLAGMPDSAFRTAQSAITRAREHNNALTVGQVLSLAAQLYYMADDYDRLSALSEESREICERNGIRYFGAISGLYQIWARAWRSRPADRIAEFRSALKDYGDMGCGLQLGLFHAMLARLLLAADRPAEAATEAETALAAFDGNDELWWTPEAHRTLGSALLATAKPNAAAAKKCFERAIAQAKRLGAPMLELRAATSLAALSAGARKGPEAKRLLAPLLARFTEGSDNADLRAAKDLLES